VDIVISAVGPGAPAESITEAVAALGRGGVLVDVGGMMEHPPLDLFSMMCSGVWQRRRHAWVESPVFESALSRWSATAWWRSWLSLFAVCGWLTLDYLARTGRGVELIDDVGMRFVASACFRESS
jgi:hypothetical protein